jgi:hypothetical protein
MFTHQALPGPSLNPRAQSRFASSARLRMGAAPG